jgi:SpoVK/Ycf46/Vps4 family AAA+-type ATPase
MVQLALDNRAREERGDPVQELSLHRLFLGNPGTGKTTVAKHYGALLKELGFLSRGDVVITNAEELKGDAVGVAATRVNAALDNALGCVLVIDEAYGLAGSSYGQQALDTLVGRVQGTPGEDFAVLMCGYSDKMMEMLRTSNPGLKRRFKADNPIIFEDYDDDALTHILLKMARERNLGLAEDVARAAVREVLSKQRSKPDFGNAGEARNLLENAVERMSLRRADALRAAAASGGAPPPLDDTLLADDFFSLAPMGAALAALGSMINAEPFLQHIRNLEKQIKAKRARGASPEQLRELLKNYIFAGPPGTGKTTVARAFGEVFKGLDLLASGEVVEVKGQDLIAPFVGQTAQLVNSKMDEALGGVLFIEKVRARAFGRRGRSSRALHKLLACNPRPPAPQRPERSRLLRPF